MPTKTEYFIDGKPVTDLAGATGEIVVKTTITPAIISKPPVTPMAKGIVCYGSDDLGKSIAVMKDCAIDRVRWWYGTTFKGSVDTKFAQQAKAWKAAGAKRVMLTCTVGVDSGIIPSIADVKSWAKSARDAYAGTIDALQILNEINLRPKYWAGTIQQAADVCAAVCDGVAGSGIEVYAPSISRDLSKLKELVATNIGTKVNGWDFHSYGANGTEHVAGVQAAKAIVGDKPLVESEFGIHAGSFSGWRVEIAKAWEGIKPFISESYCYRLIANGQPAGKFGFVTESFAKNPETYETWKARK